MHQARATARRGYLGTRRVSRARACEPPAEAERDRALGLVALMFCAVFGAIILHAAATGLL